MKPATHWQVPHKFSAQRKITCLITSGMPEPHFPISITGCLPPSTSRPSMHSQAALDPCNPGQTVPIWYCLCLVHILSWEKSSTDILSLGSFPGQLKAMCLTPSHWNKHTCHVFCLCNP